MEEAKYGRRPISTRNKTVFIRIASWLAKTGVSPNGISTLSAVFGIFAGISLSHIVYLEEGQRMWGWLIAAACIQCRLLCNMFDGMVAIESGKTSDLGEIFNDYPDRISDVAILVGLGYAPASSLVLGYWCAILAVMTAYTRMIGKVTGAPYAFHGPMAKQHRMFISTLVCVVCAFAPVEFTFNPSQWELSGWGTSLMVHLLPWFATDGKLMAVQVGVPMMALEVIFLGCVVTLWRRLSFIAKHVTKKDEKKE